MKRLLAITALALMLAWGLGVSGAMAWYLDFNVHSENNPGSISYAGGAAPLEGSGIVVDDVMLQDAAYDASISLSGAVLNFVTGNLVSYDNAGTYETWTFGPGGYISITDPQYSAPLMYGSWENAIVMTLYDGGVFSLQLAAGSYLDHKNGLILCGLGLPGYECADALVGNFAGGLNLTFIASVNDNTHAFTSTSVNTGDVPNTPVPVPGAAWLLGSGLLGLLGVRRRRS